MITLQQIAEQLGINRSTVSKALRGAADLNPETAKKIREAAVRLGYDQNRLRDKQSVGSTVGIVFPELKSLYYNKICESFCEEIRAAGYRPIVSLYNFASLEEQLQEVKYFQAQKTAGILYLTESEFEAYQISPIFKKSGTKTVMITLNGEINFCDTICNNHALGVQLAVNHLKQLGHRRIAFLGDPHTGYRKRQFLSAMKKSELPIRDSYIKESGLRFEESGYTGMKQLLALREPPTACFAAYDNMAYGAIKAVQDAGLSVPRDMSVLGIDDNTTSKYCNPPLTSINSPETEIGTTAAKFLIERMNGASDSYRNILICPTLKQRASTAPPNSDTTEK